MKNIDKLKDELKRVVEQGKGLINTLDSTNESSFKYQEWYVPASNIVQRFLPDRIGEFNRYYESPNSEPNVYTIKDYMDDISSRISINILREKANKSLRNQVAILKSIETNIDSYIFNLDAEIYYEYQEDELEAAKTVFKVNIRAAGALCGVVIEKHLKRLLGEGVSKIKGHPTIQSLAQQLKQDSVIDILALKNLEYLASIRNLCDHQKDRDPTKEEVQALIDGAERVIKTIY